MLAPLGRSGVENHIKHIKKGRTKISSANGDGKHVCIVIRERRRSKENAMAKDVYSTQTVKRVMLPPEARCLAPLATNPTGTGVGLSNSSDKEASKGPSEHFRVISVFSSYSTLNYPLTLNHAQKRLWAISDSSSEIDSYEP